MKHALVFSGGSTKIPIHVGFVKALYYRGIEYDEFYGNSAGSIIAACLADGHDIGFIEELIFSVNFNDFLKISILDNILGFMNRSYLAHGNYMYEFLSRLFKNKKFRDLKNYLCITGHSLEEEKSKNFNNDNSPDMPIALAIRISSSLPILFKPVFHNGEHFVDGGISKDFPVDLCKKKYIGHLIQDKVSIPKNPLKINKIKMAEIILSELIQSNCEESIRNNPNGIVVRSEYKRPFWDFKIKVEEKEEMINIGYYNTLKIIDKII